MSHFNDFETTIIDEAGLVRALCRNGFKETDIERNETPTNLFGYQGDRREQKAHVILRRKYIGSASNDIGFEKTDDGTYRAHISDYDKSRFDNQWLSKLYTYYNVEKSKIALEEKGIPYTETIDKKGRIQLRAKFKTSDVNTSRIKVRG